VTDVDGSVDYDHADLAGGRVPSFVSPGVDDPSDVERSQAGLMVKACCPATINVNNARVFGALVVKG
jgi:hypothetical protein